MAGVPGQAAFVHPDGHAFGHVVEEVDHVHTAHADAPVAGRTADVEFLGRAVDVDGAAVGVAGFALGHRMRVTMGSRPGAFGRRISPVGLRLLKTMPGGRPLPIFLATRIFPTGVQLLPGLSPSPNLEVETL